MLLQVVAAPLLQRWVHRTGVQVVALMLLIGLLLLSRTLPQCCAWRLCAAAADPATNRRTAASIWLVVWWFVGPMLGLPQMDWGGPLFVLACLLLSWLTGTTIGDMQMLVHGLLLLSGAAFVSPIDTVWYSCGVNLVFGLSLEILRAWLRALLAMLASAMHHSGHDCLLAGGEGGGG